jgi:autotransporter-associated beta strand protein
VTISEGTTVAARSLTFTADGYTIAPASQLAVARLALTSGGSGGPGPNTIEVVDTGHTATIAATITGNPGVGLTKTGAGTLVLAGVNTYTGPTTINAGVLKLASSQALAGCSLIDLGPDATLDLTAVAGGYYLGSSGNQELKGNGTILGNLQIASHGIHDIGNSPGVQRLEGDYAMCGLLKIEAGGATPGNGAVGYDQIQVTGSSRHDVLLDGDLALTWSGAGWSSGSDRLWIIRNDTNGILSGTFHGYPNGAVVGNYDGHSWRIYYGVDFDAISGQIVAGNDVLLTSATPIPEPSSLGLAICGLIAMTLVRRRWLVALLGRM